jgi:hypothetical protein
VSDGHAPDGQQGAQDGSTGPVLFVEEQRFRQLWLRGLVLLGAALVWTVWVDAVFGARTADVGVWVAWGLTGVAIPVALLLLRLETTVEPGRLRVRFAPFTRGRTVELTSVLDVRAVTVRPIVEWGGYGYRRNLRKGVAYLVQGTGAVQLSLGAGAKLVVGSQRPDVLARAVLAAGAPDAGVADAPDAG